jgi:hypothetical protein
MNRRVYFLFVSVALMSLGGCALGTEGDEPAQETGKTARSGTIETAPPAAEPEVVSEAPASDETNTRHEAVDPLNKREPGVPEAPHSRIPPPRPPGPAR